MKESKYVRVANTIQYNTIQCSVFWISLFRIPLFLHKKSNHIFTVRQHIVLLVLRQYENKSYRMFVEWLFKEAYYLRMFMQLSHIPHYTTLQKFAARVSGTMLEKIISSFVVLLSNIRRLFIGIIDSSGFKLTIYLSIYPMLPNIIQTK